jgi:tRNA(Ile)-lysidine synthase
LLEVSDALDLRIAAAHLNHQLRGDASDEDARWLERLCGALGVPLIVGRIDIAAAARAAGRGLEETAREERYRFLEETSQQLGCRQVAVAHTADDQAETILHNVLRGTGLAGLAGMPVAREWSSGIRLVRPLLALRRSDVLEFLYARGQDYREDASNADEAFTRNRLRHQVLPHLARDFNPQLVNALCRLGQQAGEAQSLIAERAAELLEESLEFATPRECQLDWQGLAGNPRHLIRELLACLWRRQNWPRQRMGFEHWERLCGILLEGGAADFPQGLQARRSGRVFIISLRADPHAVA